MKNLDAVIPLYIIGGLAALGWVALFGVILFS